MQSAVSPFTVCDLRGDPLETCRATVSLCITCAVLLAHYGRSFALCFSETLQILAPFPNLIAGLYVSMGLVR